jgi:hypothetical protein
MEETRVYSPSSDVYSRQWKDFAQLLDFFLALMFNPRRWKGTSTTKLFPCSDGHPRQWKTSTDPDTSGSYAIDQRLHKKRDNCKPTLRYTRGNKMVGLCLADCVFHEVLFFLLLLMPVLCS